MPGLSTVTNPTPSPDGKTLALRGRDSVDYVGIHLLDLETGAIRRLEGADGAPLMFSPDGNRLLYRRLQPNALFTIPVSGGTPLPIAEAGAGNGTWLDDGSIVYDLDDALWILPGSGEDPRPLTTRDSLQTQFGNPAALPGGRHVVFQSYRGGAERSDLLVLDVQNGDVTRLGFGSHPRYLASGHLLYGDGSSPIRGPLMVRPFDARKRAFTGPEVALHQDAPQWLYGVDRFGTWYSLLQESSPVPTTIATLDRLDANGTHTGTLFSGDVENPRLSPDGGRVALTVEAGEDDWLMILDFDTGVEQRITFSGDVDHYAWSADGEQIMAVQSGVVGIWSARGLGLIETLPIEPASFLDWSRDGRYVVYVRDGSDNGPLHLYDMQTGRDTLFESRTSSRPRFSPDGRYVAYESPGEDGVASYVRSTTGSGFDRIFVDAPQNRRPVWSRDGTQLFVDGWQSRLVRIPVDISHRFVQQTRGEDVIDLGAVFEFDVGPDGSFYVLGVGALDDTQFETTAPATARMSVTVNWFERIKRLAPPSR